MYRKLPSTESSECLGNMTPETQDIYLRMDHLRRRSGYRLGRIIARQQLLKRKAAGMTRWNNMAYVIYDFMSQSCCVLEHSKVYLYIVFDNFLKA